MSNPLKSLSLLAAAMLLVSGCASTRMAGEPPESQPRPVTGPPTVEEAVEYPVRPFPADTLYELLVAEFAGMRNRVDLALDGYRRQAALTRDPGVVARAARIASYLNDQEAMLELSELWVEVEPESPDARRLLIYAMASDGRVLEAFPHARYLLLEGDSEHLQTLAAFSSDATAEERARLLSLFDELAQIRPDDPSLLLGRAILYRQQNQLEEAAATARRLLEVEPAHESAALLLAQVWHQGGDITSGIQTLETALGILPESKRLRLQLARFLAETDPAKSRDQMLVLVDQHPEDSDLRYSLGLISRELGYRDEAVEIYEDLVSNNQRAADAHFQLGRIAEEEQRFAEALTHYRQVRRGSNFVPAAIRLSGILAAGGELDTARLYLHRLRREQPQQAVTLYQLESDLLMEQDNPESAYQVLSDGLDQYPDNITLLYSRSLVSERLQNIESAEIDLRAILARDRDNATAMNALGYSLTNHTDRYDEAHQLITRALELNPGDPAIMDSLGWVLYRMGRIEESLVQLRKAMAALPEPEVAAHLGEVLWISGAQDEARVIWNQVLETDPDNRFILDTMQRLNAD